MIKQFFQNLFTYKEPDSYEFMLPDSSNNIPNIFFEKKDETHVFKTTKENFEYLKVKYNTLINSDIKTRDFVLPIKNQNLNCFIIYIDGMVDDDGVNDYILNPLLLKNSITMSQNNSNFNNSINSKIAIKNVRKFNVEDFIYNGLIPQNSISKETTFSEIIPKINSGFCVLFVDTIDSAFCVEVKGFKGRSVSEPVTESVVKGAQEGFVENLRTNTSLLRKIINNEKLIIEEISIGALNKTKVAICYLKDITNDDLVAEAKYRLNNLDIDFLLSSGELEQFISDSPTSSFPQAISTERPDRTSSYILNGRIAILINGSPFAIIIPSLFIDYLTTPEDLNLNYKYTNFLRFIRGISIFFALLLPGLYVAITNYHHELIPSELLFAIITAREAIPFPIIFEIFIMEFSFELIREASIRVSSNFSTTVGIIGALILGDAAVSAKIVSPILIIVVAFTGICGFAISDNSLRFSVSMFRFIYIILGYIAGFLGIAFGFFIQFIMLSCSTSFGVPFFAPYIPLNLNSHEKYFINPVWKREFKSNLFNTKKPQSEKHISMKWRYFKNDR